MPDYSIGKLNGKLVLVYWRDGKRKRYSLGTSDPREAERTAPSLYAELTRVKGTHVKSLWEAYCIDKSGHAIIRTMRHTWKAIAPHFGGLPGDAITIADCRAHIASRRQRGIKDGTLLTELGHLRTVLKWAEKHRLITKASHIERPPAPKPKEGHLTHSESRSLREAASVPHVRLYILLAQTTGARNAALLELTWDRCLFDRNQIDLRNPLITIPHKGRAIVPMNRNARAALLEARNGALTPYVIEWAGRPVKSVKRGLQAAARKAGLGHVSPHLLRHSVAVHLAEDGHSMASIAQFLGHSNSRETERVYARFSPDFHKGMAASLEYDDLSEAQRRKA